MGCTDTAHTILGSDTVLWWVGCCQMPTQPLALLNSTWDKIRWQSSSLEINIRWRLPSYRQNTLQFGQTNSEPDCRTCQKNLLQLGPQFPQEMSTCFSSSSILGVQRAVSSLTPQCPAVFYPSLNMLFPEVPPGSPPARTSPNNIRKKFHGRATARCLITPHIQSHTHTKWTD